MTQVSRRHLLAGAAGAAAVYGAATAHAATTSDLNICATPKFDESFDLVVIGSGGAGLSSAVMAKQQGVKRILVWKDGIPRRKHCHLRRRLQQLRSAPTASSGHQGLS